MKYRLFILAAAALFSTGGAAIKATTFTNWQVAAFRSGIATLAILAFIPTARHVGDRRIWLTGIAYAVTLIAFVTATKLTTAANAIFLEDSAPLFLVLAGPWLLKEKVKAHDLAILAIMGCGLALFFAGAQPGSRTAPEPMRGNLIGLVSGAGWAATIAGLRILESRPHGQSPGLAGGRVDRDDILSAEQHAPGVGADDVPRSAAIALPGRDAGLPVECHHFVTVVRRENDKSPGRNRRTADPLVRLRKGPARHKYGRRSAPA